MGWFLSRSVIAPRFSSTSPSSEKFLRIRAGLMCRADPLAYCIRSSICSSWGRMYQALVCHNPTARGSLSIDAFPLFLLHIDYTVLAPEKAIFISKITAISISVCIVTSFRQGSHASLTPLPETLLFEKLFQILLRGGDGSNIEVLHKVVQHIGRNERRQRGAKANILDPQIQQRRQDAHCLLLIPRKNH